MRKFASYIIFTLLLAAIACACSDNIDIRQGYEFQVTHLPVPKKIKVGQTVEIRCQLERSGYFNGAVYRFR
ncbi:TraQ conjugal transfer family protein [Dysgonomonas sp. 511]|uniref:TraQ conjugal transfer family protein n=1 Tax=Dysgonomonas sp. 511 TaxID=2302930 RepID=UPI0021041BA2|nr:TraQ conjugal transfer family protein [Dysgonomonas sp. 511]